MKIFELIPVYIIITLIIHIKWSPERHTFLAVSHHNEQIYNMAI